MPYQGSSGQLSGLSYVPKPKKRPKPKTPPAFPLGSSRALTDIKPGAIDYNALVQGGARPVGVSPPSYSGRGRPLTGLDVRPGKAKPPKAKPKKPAAPPRPAAFNAPTTSSPRPAPPRSSSAVSATGGATPSRPAQRSQAATRPPARAQAGVSGGGVSDSQTLSLEEQARQQVMGSVNPVVAEIQRAIGDRIRSGMASITGLTNQYAQNLAPIAGQSREIFDRAQTSQQGSDTALANRLGQVGQIAGGELAAKMNAIGAPQRAVAETAGVVPTTATGAANAGFAQGSATLGELISRGAGAQDYAAKLPGFARLGGIQAAGQLQGNLSRDLAEQIGAIQAKVPGMVQETTTSLRSNELAQEAARQNRFILEREYGRKVSNDAFDKRYKVAGYNLQVQKAAQGYDATLARIGIQDKNLALRAAELDYKMSLPRTKKGGFTAQQKQHLAVQALETAKTDFDGGYTDPGTGDFIDTGKKQPVETLKDLLAANVPFKIAVKALQRYWPHTKAWSK